MAFSFHPYTKGLLQSGKGMTGFHISFPRNSVTSQPDEKTGLVHTEKIPGILFLLHAAIYRYCGSH